MVEQAAQALGRVQPQGTPLYDVPGEHYTLMGFDHVPGFQKIFCSQLEGRSSRSRITYFAIVSDLALTAPDQLWIHPYDYIHMFPSVLKSDDLRESHAGHSVAAPTRKVFRQLKLDEGSRNVGEIKVSVVLPTAEYVKWFANRVRDVREL